MNKTESLLIAIVTVAIATTFVLPREGNPVPKTLQTISKYVSNSVGYVIGKKSGNTERP